MSTVIWSNGRLRDPRVPIVCGIDRGLTVGEGAFETCAILDGRAFALSRHLRRLARSVTGLGIGMPDEDELRQGIDVVLAAAGPGAGRLRVTITAGPGPLGATRADLGESPPTVIVLAGPAAPAGTVRAVRVPWVRNERSAVAGLKTTSYAENVVALAEAHRRGADEAILANTVGALCEGTGSNVFVERGGELLTPALSAGCLAGVTRELLLEWSVDAGLPVRVARQGELPFEVLDEVVEGGAQLALSGSIRAVVPVLALDGHALRPGTLSLAAQRLFADRSAHDLDP